MNEINDKIFAVKTKCSKVLNTFRNTIDGKEVAATEVSKILSESPDRELRKKALCSRSQVNKPLVDAGFIDLINLRKKYAEVYGAKDFVELSLKRDELSSGLFDSWRTETTSALPVTHKKRSEFAQEYLGQEQLEPWDTGYLTGKISPLINADVDMVNYFDPMCGLYEKFGIDLKNMGITFDVFPRKHKSEWGYHFTITPGKDSRILANIDNKFLHFRVLLHEAGHGIHFKSVDPVDTLMNDGISGIISEGIANLFGNMYTDEIFYEQFFADELDAARKQFARSEQWNKVNSLAGINAILFDQELFRNNLVSLEDINELYWSMSKELSGIEQYDEQGPWGFRIHHTTHPIYLHNYFMGDVTCEMLKKSFATKHGGSSLYEKPKEFGDFLMNDVIKVSGRYKYEELFEQLSGASFSLKYILDDD